MRTEAFLSILIMALAFASGALVLSIKNSPALGITAPILQQEILKFKKATSAIDHFRTDSLSETFDPQKALPFYFEFDYQEIQNLQKFSTTCEFKNYKKSAKLAKAWQWEESQCGQKKLSDDFFSREPFIHPSGASFAYLAKKDMGWAKNHLNLFHVSELRDLKISALPTPYKYFESLEIDSMVSLASVDPLVLTDKFVFLDSQNDEGYLVYPRATWDQYWFTTPFFPHAVSESENCFIKDKSVCWTYDFKKAYFPKWNPLVFILCILILLAVSMTILLGARIYRRQQDQLRMKFTLEMLAHEIRTPAANLALTVENFRPYFDQFPEEAKSGLLRLFDQVERIKRVAESSQNYLHKDLGKNLIKTNFSEIKSLNEFINHTLDAYMSQIKLEMKDQDLHVKLDPYWTSICIKNLVENALMHGEKPVHVIVQQNEKNWSIEILDHGVKVFDPMSKSHQSAGFGLGFKIVKNIIPQLNANMQISYNPTKITLYFGENR